MSLSSTYKTNPAKETEGVWADFGEAIDDGKPTGKRTRFHLSRMSRSNKRYTKATERLTRPHRRAIELETINNDVADSVMMDIFCESVLLGWENVLMSDVTGDANARGFAEFNKENAVKLLKNLPELYADLEERAKKAALFRDEVMENEAKN